MTPVERLQAAIDKLERLKAETEYQVTADGWLIEYVSVGTELVPRFEPAPLTSDELIVTLHRTIDAQLAILRDGIARVHSWTDPDSQVGYEPHLDGPYPPGADATYLALADAILGGES